MTNTTNTTAAKHYAKRDPEAQGTHYENHVYAMTTEGLHAKSAIAAELAHRDIEIERLRAALAAPAQAAPGASEIDIYVWPVPDKCDRIVWRGAYHHLPIQKAAPAHAGEYPDLPEESKRDDLGGLVPSDIRQALRAYVDADRAARAAPVDVAVQQDAERYRYLRNDVLVAGVINETLYVHVDHPDRWALVGTELDEAIDAAREQK